MSQSHGASAKKASTSVNDYVAHCTRILKEAGYRMTMPRLAIMQCLAQQHQGLTPKEILETIARQKKTADVDQVTVYRILERFTELGLTHRLPNGTFVPCAHEEHDHKGAHVFTHCRSCERTEEQDVPDEILQPLLWFIAKAEGFVGALHTIQIEGRCRACLATGFS